MSRIHTVAAVLIGTGLASASMFSGSSPNGPQDPNPTRQVQQSPDPKFRDPSSLLSNVPPGVRSSTPDVSQGLPGKPVLPGHQNLGTCPCGGAPPEGEAGCGIPTDSFNGGCNSTPVIYSAIAVGASVCGTAAWDGSTRDTDWYRFTLGAPSGITWSVTAEFDVVIFVIDNACPPTILFSGSAAACTPAVIATPVLPAGTYVVFVAPDFNGPIITCGTSDDYRGTLTGVGCSSPANDPCAGAIAISGNGPFFGSNNCSVLDGPSTCGTLGADVWYNWTSNTTGNVTFNTCNPGTTYDTVLSVYDGAGCTGTQLGCNDDVPCTPIFRSGLTVPVLNGNIYKVQVGGYNGATGNFELNVVLPCASPANDNCGAATAISGTGPFLGTNCGAVLDGPSACGGLDADVWYNWTANTTGAVTFNLCNPGTTYDTVLSVYDGAGCTGTPLGCNDDVPCTPIYRSGLTVPVTNGNIYKIQIGGFFGATGNFELTVDPPPNYSVCQYDDGVSERAWTLSAVANEECLWLERYGSIGDVTLVTSVSVTFGSPLDPWPPSPNGTPAKVYLWDDPNDDGDPIDAVLLRTTNVVVANGDTDIFVTGALSPAVVVNGAYFIGASIITTTGNDVNMAIDHSVPSLGRSWTFGNPGGLADATTLSNNSFSLEMDQLDPGVWMLRSACGAPIVSFCNPGTGGVIPCPCANPPSGGNRGCNNFGQFTGGASLAGSGVPSISADTLSLAASGENNTSTTVFWGGAALTPPAGVIHAAGVRCVLNSGLKRLYTGQASGGAITRPGMGGPSVHIAHGGISAGQTRYYFTIYRDPQAATPAHCNQVSSTVNLSNALAVTWLP